MLQPCMSTAFATLHEPPTTTSNPAQIEVYHGRARWTMSHRQHGGGIEGRQCGATTERGGEAGRVS
jgi:hypothetical protein